MRSVSRRRLRRIKPCLGRLADERSNVLVLHVGVGIEFRTLSRVGSLDIVHEELQTTLGLTILGMSLTIKHIRLGYLIVALGHQGHLDLVLDLLHTDAVMHTQARQDSTQGLLRSESTYCHKSLGNSVLDFVDGKQFLLAITFDNVSFHTVVYISNFSSEFF